MEKKKKLLIVANRFYPQLGGAEINIFVQAQELAKRFEVDVYCPRRDPDPTKEEVEGITIYRFASLLNVPRQFPDQRAKTLSPGMVWGFLMSRYDLVHCFPSANYNNILILLLSKLKNIPVYLTVFDLFDYAQLLEAGESIDPLPPMTKMQRLFLPLFKKVFTISCREKNLIAQVNKHSVLSIVPAKLDEFQSTPSRGELFRFRDKFGIEGRFFLCMSRVCYIKGQDILVSILPELIKENPDVQVLIAGREDYDPEFVEGLKASIEREGLGSNVIFAGPLERGEAVAALHLCEAHILPMRFMNSGAVVAETWAASRPVVQSSGIDPNYVVDGETGYSFDKENPRELLGRMMQILENPELASQMGQEGRKFVEEKLTYDSLIEQYQESYST